MDLHLRLDQNRYGTSTTVVLLILKALTAPLQIGGTRYVAKQYIFYSWPHLAMDIARGWQGHNIFHGLVFHYSSNFDLKKLKHHWTRHLCKLHVSSLIGLQFKKIFFSNFSNLRIPQK